MKAVTQIARLLLNADPWAMARGAALAVTVLAMGAALLGLSGWFIVATGLAGLAGLGIAFDVFRPSAGIRFLALGRTAARYGERLLTHDATLRALAALRVVLLRGYARLDARSLMGLRSESALTRIVADVDALDGLILRLVLPAAAALVTHAGVFAMLWWLVGLPVAAAISAVSIPATALLLMVLARRTVASSAAAEEIGQHLRRGVIDTIRDRDALILAGGLRRSEDRLLTLDAEARAASGKLDRAERDAGFFLSVLVALVAAAAFLAGAILLEDGRTDPALAVVGLFVALALAETMLPLRRGFAELGRMTGAANRIAPHTAIPDAGPTAEGTAEQPLLTVTRADFRLELHAGETLVVTGPSGAGKSTLLMQLAGLHDDAGVRVKGLAPSAWSEPALRKTVAALPQRSELIAGTIRDNMSLAGNVHDEAIWSALDTVFLSEDIRMRGGLDLRLGEAGTGLSGGQARRLCLARALLRAPDLLLLDEPLEGLDGGMAKTILANIRAHLPEAGILVCSHKYASEHLFDRRYNLVR